MPSSKRLSLVGQVGINEGDKALAVLAQRYKARRTLIDFTRWTKPNYSVQWYHRHLCGVLDRFISGELKRVMVFMPPRHGKSELVSRRLPAYILGSKPDSKIIACSYGDSLAKDMNRDCQDIMDSGPYLDLFPESVLPGSISRTIAHGQRIRNSETFQLALKKYTGQYTGAGVGGPITGKGADFGIIDDPVKNEEEANSSVIREKVYRWYTSTFYTRLEGDASILLTMTRWHEDDLAGRLLALAAADPDADQWHVINFPAVCEVAAAPDERQIGEVLWPGKFGPERMKKIKTVVGPRVWAGLYQGHPCTDEGGLFPESCWEILPKPPARLSRTVRYWDRAATQNGGSDYTVGTLMGMRDGGGPVVLDVVRLQGTPDIVEATIKNIAACDGTATTIGIEEDPGSAGKFESAYYVRQLSGYDVRVVPARDNKVVRARPYSAQALAGNVALVNGPWVPDFVFEHKHFPWGRHDDQVDATGGAFGLLLGDIGYAALELNDSALVCENQWRR